MIFRSRLFHALAIILSAVFTIGATQGSIAMSNTQTVTVGTNRIILTCPAEVKDADALCAAMETALSEAAPNRHISKGKVEMAAGDLAVTLKIIRETKTILEGQLEWQKTNGPVTVGPPVTISVQDSTLSPQMFGSFVAGLLKVSNLPLDEHK